MEQRHRILLVIAAPLKVWATWLRIGLQRRNNRRIVRALREDAAAGLIHHQRLKQGRQLPFGIPFCQGLHAFTHLGEDRLLNRIVQPHAQEPLNGVQQRVDLPCRCTITAALGMRRRRRWLPGACLLPAGTAPARWGAADRQFTGLPAPARPMARSAC